MRTAAALSETTMRCLRIYATPDGESHFDEIDIPTTKRPVFPDTAPFELSAHFPASRIRFTRIPAVMHEVSYHTVPERVLTVRLDGSQSKNGERAGPPNPSNP
jgi:hypothetical protein